jgi:hypothetical protein
MKHTVFLLTILVLFLTGCVTTELSKEPEQLGGIGIIPVECPPIMITPRNDAESRALDAYMETPGYQTGDFKIYTPEEKADLPPGIVTPAVTYPGVSGSQASGIVTIVGVMGSLLGASMEDGSTVGSQVQSDKHSAGVLINELPKIARNLLESTGVENVSIINGYVQLPIADRSLDPLLSNWKPPLSSYVKSSTPTIDYSEIDDGSYDTILEVGIANYEVYQGRLSLLIFIKMIDVQTNQVIASTRKINYGAKKQQLETLLENDAEGLQQLSRDTARKLIADCLAAIGIPEKR